MEKTSKIMRTSIYTFLQNYHYFTMESSLLALPFALSVLLSQAFLHSSSSSLMPTIHNRLTEVFKAAGFPLSSEFFTILSIKLSQTTSSSIFTLPFTLTFFLFAKASVVLAFDHDHGYNKKRLKTLYTPLLITHIFNSFLLVSANATTFCFLFLCFNFIEGFEFSTPTWIYFFSSVGTVVYSIILANALIITNLALVLSGMERSEGFLATLKACALIRGRTSTALSLAVPLNFGFAAIEALFQYRIVSPYNQFGIDSSIALEGMLIAFLYSTFVVVETIVNCTFYISCISSGFRIEPEDQHHYSIEVIQEEEEGKMELKNSEIITL